jgi:hypothetical protein
MSYLNFRQDIPSFKKAIISLWFKVPQASLDKVSAADNTVLNGIVPLVVMGKEGTYNTPYNTDVSRALQYVIIGTYGSAGPDIRTDTCINYTTVNIGGSSITYCADREITYTWSPGLTWVQYPPGYVYTNVQHSSISGPGPPKNPSYIGVDSDGFLRVNFETAKQADASNWRFEVQSISPGSQIGPSPPLWGGGPSSSPPPNPNAFPVGTNSTVIHYNSPLDFLGTVTSNVVGQTWENNPAYPGSLTHAVNNWVDITNVVLNSTGSIGNVGTQVTADEWHHVLVSVDLTNLIETHGTSSRFDVVGPISPYVDSAVKLYLAVDDVNKTTWDLSVWVYPDGGPNDVITQEAADVAGAIRTYDGIYSNGTPEEVPVGGIASYSLDASIPSGVIGLPAPSKYVSQVLHCEMAEFQMWIGVSLDTGVEANRRVFIDYKRDSTGAPIPDKNGKLTLVPVDPAKAAALLGRRPDVELHKSSNWIKGNNTGTIGAGPDGKPISAGQFTPTGVIKKYKPDPSIVVM